MDDGVIIKQKVFRKKYLKNCQKMKIESFYRSRSLEGIVRDRSNFITRVNKIPTIV